MIQSRLMSIGGGSKVGVMSLAMLAAAGLAGVAQGAALYWAPPATGSGTYADRYIMTGNWWDGVGSDPSAPGNSDHWAAAWSGTTPGTLPWTQGSIASFPNKGSTGVYTANLTIYGNVEVSQFSGNGASTAVNVTAAGASDALTVGAGGFDIETVITLNTPVVLNAPDVPTKGYQAVFNGAIGDGGNHYGLHVLGAFGSLSAQTFNGVNTYTGATTIESGNFKLGASGSIAASSGVNMVASSTWGANGNAVGLFTSSAQDGATIKALSGTGVVAAASDKGNGGLIVSNALTPGTASSTSTLALQSGDLTLGNGATYNYLVDGSGATLATDLVDISGTHLNSGGDTVVANPNGTVKFAGNWTVALADLGTVDSTAQPFVLFQLGNSNTVDLGNWSIDYGTTGWSGGTISQDGNQIVLTMVPEPASGALTLLGLGGLLVRRKRATVA